MLFLIVKSRVKLLLNPLINCNFVTIVRNEKIAKLLLFVCLAVLPIACMVCWYSIPEESGLHELEYLWKQRELDEESQGYKLVFYSGFQLTVESNRWIYLVLLYYAVIGLKNSRHLLDQSDAKPKPIATCRVARVFPRLALVTCIGFEFSSVHWVVYVRFDWPL